MKKGWMFVLKGTSSFDGEISQDFTYNERETAVALGKVWQKKNLNPRLMAKSWDGRFFWISLEQQKLAA